MRVVMAGVALAIGLSATACEEERGPAERAGEKIDRVGDAVEDAGDN